MKKFFITISTVFIIAFLSSLTARAESTYSSEMQYVIDYCTEHWPNSTLTDYVKADLDTHWNNLNELYVRVYNGRLIFYVGDFNTSSEGVSNLSGNTFYQQYGNVDYVGTNNTYNFNFTYAEYPDGIGSHYFGTRDEVQENLIDYDIVYYSPLIPNVDFSVVLNTSGVPVNDIDSEYNAFTINVNSNVGNDYYIQIGYKVHVPNKMALGVNDNGTAYYSAITYNNATFQNVYSLSDNQVAFTGSVNSALFTWTRQEVPSSNWITVSSLDGQTSFINGSISAYNDLMSYIMPLYGKKIEIFMRYFVIQDNQVIVGAWSHWNNTYPKQYTQELPANYIPFHDVPGLEQTNNNTDYQNNSDSISTIGQTTGQTNVSVYNSNVPNYPDYPTAVTYNHDNILTQMIETTQKLPTFFGEFTGFCKECMTILPAEIWEVIAFGFMCSILVMIVKVL